MDIVEFKAEHLSQMDLQDGQSYLSDLLSHEQAKAIEHTEWAFTGVCNGRVMACGGILPVWPGRGMTWAYLSDKAKASAFVQVHRAAKAIVDNCFLHRLEATVDVDFEPGHRWVKLLGFDLEAPVLKNYRPDGGDCSLYARVL